MAGGSRRERAREKPGARERKRPRGKKRARVVERIREREIHTVRESRPELARRPLASDPSSLAGHLLRPCRPPRRPTAAPRAPVRPLLARGATGGDLLATPGPAAREPQGKVRT